MLGKHNYLCGTRLAQALRRREGIFDGSDGSESARELRLIRDWAARPGCTGLREHLPQRVSDEVWESVNADSSACSRRHCFPDTCFYQRARAAIGEADIVVVNHHLLFSLVGAGAAPQGDETGILYPNDFAVIDEAHNVPDVATSYFGTEISSAGVQRLLARVASAFKKGGVRRFRARKAGRSSRTRARRRRIFSRICVSVFSKKAPRSASGSATGRRTSAKCRWAGSRRSSGRSRSWNRARRRRTKSAISRNASRRRGSPSANASSCATRRKKFTGRR